MSKLQQEGHQVVATKTTNWKVLDYKETMVDISTLNVPAKEIAIGFPGNFWDYV